MPIRIICYCFALILFLSGQHAAAARISQFDFLGPFLVEQNVEGLPLSAEPGGEPLTVTPTGGVINGNPGDDALVDAIRSDWGLGLLNQNPPAVDDRGSLFRRFHVDGTGQPEVLRLEFSRAVRVEEVFFAFAGPFERFDLAVDGADIDVSAVFGTDEIYQLAPPGHAPGTVLFPASLPFGSTWEFLARNTTDEWNLEGMDVVVPAPSSMLGLLSLAAMALVGRRRRRRRVRHA